MVKKTYTAAIATNGSNGGLRADKVEEDEDSPTDIHKYSRPLSLAVIVAVFALMQLAFYHDAFNVYKTDANDATPNRNASGHTHTTSVHNTTIHNASLFLPRHRTGSWLGDIWIPPEGWRLYNAREIQDTFQGKSVLWLGDSTARRTAASMYALLNGNRTVQTQTTSVQEMDHAAVVDKHKRAVDTPCQRHGWNAHLNESNYTTPWIWHPFLCFPMPPNTRSAQDQEGDYIMVDRSCFKDVNEFLWQEINATATNAKAKETGENTSLATVINHANVLIISDGIWHNVRARDCDTKGGIEVVKTHFHSIFKALIQLEKDRPDLTIIWRTTGFSEKHDPTIMYQTNEHVMDQFDQHILSRRRKEPPHHPLGLDAHGGLTYVHWGGAIQARSFGKERLNGDIPAHYGLTPRLVLIQMITNVLREQQQLKGQVETRS